MSKRVSIISFLLLARLLTSEQSHGGEVLFCEGFELLDLSRLPPAYRVISPQCLSIVDEPGRGKALKISNTRPGDTPALEIALDAAKVKGHPIRIAAKARFPGHYTPIPGKNWARPKILLTCKGKDGKDEYPGGENLQPNKPEWVVVQNIAEIPADASAVSASIRVEESLAEVYFDDFSVEVDPDPKSAPPTAPEVAHTSVKIPAKTLEDGIVFNADIVSALERGRAKTSVVAGTIVYAGPGLPLKELDGKSLDNWDIRPNKYLIGAQASPRTMLLSLPDLLFQSKAEVAVLFGDNGTIRKPSSSEELDWEDLALLCLRMGVVPVLAVPPGEAQDSIRGIMTEAASNVGCPVIDMKSPSFVARRIAELTVLLDKYVFARVSPDAPSGPQKPAGSDE